MKYKVTNTLVVPVKGKDKPEIRYLTCVFEEFEGVIDKIARDLQSVWKEVVPLPITFTIEEVSDDEPPGMKMTDENGEFVAENDKEVTGAFEEVANSVERLKKMEAAKNGNV